MPAQTWTETLLSGSTDGPALTNSVTETSIAPANTKAALAAQTFDRVASQFRLIVTGRISTVVTSPGTLTFRLKLGPTANINVATGPAFALNVVAKTNVPWWLEWLLTVRTSGSGTTATLMNVGTWTSEAVIGSPLPSAGGSGSLFIPAATPAVGTGFDSTVANTFDLTAQWSTANAANSIQVHQLMLQSLN
jgi:hypothetical protein